MDINWGSIRPLNGQRQKGFEELCAQLARAEVGVGARFVRKGDPDAGVECYAEYEDGTQCGWQAKYFHKLEESQWRQIDRSVKNAIQKHPQLRRYVVCLPKDLAEGNREDQESARDKWNRRVARWEE
ncbi:MAG: hypothetical protein F4181_00430, partial [Proteobacteria bacterium]|nr:hypothetical protein [Pseudomonadota bacterium]